MKLLYGTTNAGKLNSMKRRMISIGIEIMGLKELKLEKLDVEETGSSPLENAVIKAKAYYDRYKLPVISCDSGLYIDGLEKSRQPGVYVRRAGGGRELNDEEMLGYYSSLAGEFGGKVKAYYKNAICLVMDGKNIFKYDGDDICSDEFLITNKVYPERTKGFPLDSISIDPKSGKYFMELDYEEEDAEHEDGYVRFIKRSLEAYKTMK